MVREDVVVKAFTWANAVLRFVLELCMLAAFAYWGSRATGSTAANVAIAIAAPLAAVAWRQPHSRPRTSPASRSRSVSRRR
jgi:hypothetical protein